MGHKRVKTAIKASADKLRSKLAKSLPGSTPSALTVTLKDDMKATVEVFTKLTTAQKDWAFALFETNMRHLYEASEDGYNPLEKQEELFHPDSRFLFLYIPESTMPVAYAMWRFDTEETAGDRFAEVVYCYEVQVDASRQSCGAGRALVDVLSQIGRDWELEKVMLTVFKSNTGALKFYERCGFVVDEISPSRIGEEEQGYEILSRPCLSTQ